MCLIYANYVRLHHRDGLDYLLQQLIPFSLPFFSQPLLLFGLSLPFFGLSLPFFGLSLSLIHSVHVFIQYPGHCR